MYDFKKIYKSKKPPISIILKEYFDNIDNFYLFFTVTNMKNCGPQLNLLVESADFINEL